MALLPPQPFRLALLAPRYWSTWLVVAAMWLIARLPYRQLLGFGRALGAVAARVMVRRRHVAERNLDLCLPELDPVARVRLLEANLRELGLLACESALGLMGSKRALRRIPIEFEGTEQLDALRTQGRGVLLLGAHFSHLELAGRVLAERVPLACLYPEHANAALVWVIKRRRLRYGEAMFSRDQTRALIKYLKSGGVILYGADHGAKGKTSVFVPFFGVPAATVTATHHLARLAGVAVIPFFQKRREGGGYVFRMEAPLADFPSADPVADAARVNLLMERMVREAPAQYLWSYKRFKERPPGAASVY